MALHKVPVTVTYRKAGTQPPIFIAGSYSDPPWQPQEMVSTVDENGECVFKAEIQARPGSRHQYKFRAGLGNWWFLDESVETATDVLGNRNNVLKVAASPGRVEAPPEIRIPGPEASDGEGLGDSPDWLDVDPFSSRGRARLDDDPIDAPQSGVPLFAHECVTSYDRSDIVKNPQYSPDNRRVSFPGIGPEPDAFDLGDPNLEEFPSRIEQIDELIHEMEDSMDEDETAVEGVAPSAVLGVPRRKTNDFVGEFMVGSPKAGQSMPRPVKRLEVPRKSMGSMSSEGSSALSLHSITEGVEDDDEEDGDLATSPAVKLLSPFSESGGSVSKSPPEQGDSKEVTPTGSPAAERRDDAQTKPGAVSSLDGGDDRGDRCIARGIQEHPDIGSAKPAGEVALVPEAEGGLIEDSVGEEHDTGEQGSDSLNTPRPIESGSGGNVRRRHVPTGGAETPNPTDSTAMETAKTGSWLRAFFGAFVDWIAGFFGRMLGGRGRR